MKATFIIDTLGQFLSAPLIFFSKVRIRKQVQIHFVISERKKVEYPTWDSNLEGTLPYWWICRRNFSRGWWSCQSDSGNLYSSQVGGKRDADNKTQWSYLLRYFNHSIVHLFFSSVKRSFNNYVDRKSGKGSVESPHLVTWQRVGIK